MPQPPGDGRLFLLRSLRRPGRYTDGMPLQSRESDSALMRDYAPLAAAMRALPPELDRGARMQAFVDAFWEAFGLVPEREASAPQGPISWIGFYTPAPGGQELVLGPRRDKPACSPIGLHGACGRAYLSRKALVVEDVSRLGEGYIACDPRDRSELVVPCFEQDGSCWGVLDIDSYESKAFTKRDAFAVMLVLRAAGLSAGDTDAAVV